MNRLNSDGEGAIPQGPVTGPHVRAIVEVLDASPEARDYLTRVDLVGMRAHAEDRSYQKRPHESGPA